MMNNLSLGFTGRFEGRVAVVTGASRGIGLAIARRIIAEGGRVCITGRRPEGLAAAVKQLGGPKAAISLAGSADDTQHQDEVIRAVLDDFGRLDILVNNTGVNPAFGSMLNADPSAVRKILEVNVIASWSWIRKAHDAWLSRNGGAVANVASVAGLRPARKIGFYGASKAALVHLTQQLASELAPRVRVNAVAPAVVRTRFAGPLLEGKEEAVVEDYPLRRLGAPEDVAAAVAYLASDDSSWVTGQILTVDGGLTLNGGV
jgi:NAD(P)-dependent dehydrogenase (short-subunit alcohol dehydrogenase family)